MAGAPQNNPGAAALSATCKIKVTASGFQVKASDMPVTIQLCEDLQRHPATSSWLTDAKVYFHATTTLAPNQPTNTTNTTYDLEANPQNKKFDVWTEVGHKPQARCYIYEACTGSPLLCAIDTSVGPTCVFTIEVL